MKSLNHGLLSRSLHVSLVVALGACGSKSAAVEPDPDPVVETDAGVTPPGNDASAPILDTGTPTPARDVVVPPPGTACEATSPRAVVPVVSTLPEAGEAPLVNVIKSAKSNLRVMIYIMGYGGILDGLIAQAKAGVKVRIIMDQGQKDTNQKYFDQLTAAGVEAKWSDPKFPYMHAKFILADDSLAVISTGNFSKTYSIDKERNYAARLEDPQDLRDLAAIFEADWGGTEPSLSCTRLLVSPINSKTRLLALINSAKTSLDVESMQFAETDIRAAIAARKQAGVAVRVLLAAPSWIDANTDAANFLKGYQIPVKYMSKPGVHVKAMTVDGKTAYLGSENLSWTSLTKNREVGIIVTDESSVAPMKQTFETDWAAATSL